MRTERILSIALVLLLLASVVPLAITPAAAVYEKKIPFAGEDNELTKDELVNDAILPYMLGEGNLKLDDVGDASWVYAYWNGNTKTIIDSEDKDVTFCRPIERLAYTSAINLELLRAVKAPTETIVGVGSTISSPGGRNHRYGVIFPEFRGLPVVDSKDPETVFKLHPDAVVYTGTYGIAPSLDIRANFEAAGVTYMLFVGYTDPEDYKPIVRAFGDIFNNEDEAEEYIEWRDNYLNAIKEKVEENIPVENRTRVYYEGGWVGHPAIGSYMYNNHIIAAGGVNIFSDIRAPPGYIELDLEELVKPERHPDVIVKMAWGGGYGVDDISALRAERDRFMDEDLWKDIPAIKEGRVYPISNDICCCGNSDKYFLAIPYLAKWFYPELFKDLDPVAFHREYLTRFQGIDYDVSEHGVFVYHPEEHPEGR